VTSRQRSLAVLLVQLLLALAVTGKLGWDRATLPRAWARVVPVDPDDPFRGRYVRLWVDAVDRRESGREEASGRVEFAVADGQLVARDPTGWSGLGVLQPPPAGARGVVVSEAMAFFIPEHVADPSRLQAGQELWVEVSVPSRGLPRPLRIQVRRSE
jgi:hypothetical protein